MLVIIRDSISTDTSGLAVHRGLVIEVDIHATSEHEARGKAVGLASLHLTAVSIATRAPVDSPNLVLLYEITASKTSDLDFAQSQDVELPLGKVPAPGTVVSRVQQALVSIPDPRKAPSDPARRTDVFGCTARNRARSSLHHALARVRSARSTAGCRAAATA